MNILKQNSDYALRMMINLAERFGSGAVSTKQLSSDEQVSEQFAAKILQKLHNAGLLKSSMGPKGGFELAEEPGAISFKQIIEAMQGAITANKCSKAIDECPRKSRCPVAGVVEMLDSKIAAELSAITLSEMLKNNGEKNHRKARK